MNDKDMIRKIQGGQKEYLDEIVLKYYNDIFRFCVYQIGNEVNSYDIVQETFFRFIKYIDSYRYRNLKGYLLTIARNLCRDYFRNMCKTECLEEINEIGVEDRGLNQVDNQLMLCTYLQKIPQEQREVIILRYFNEFMVSEISSVLGVNLSTVKSRLRLGVKNLKRVMEEQI